MHTAAVTNEKFITILPCAFDPRPIIVTIRLVVSKTYFIKGKFVDFWLCFGFAVYTFGAVSFVQINRKAKKKTKEIEKEKKTVAIGAQEQEAIIQRPLAIKYMKLNLQYCSAIVVRKK